MTRRTTSERGEPSVRFSGRPPRHYAPTCQACGRKMTEPCGVQGLVHDGDCTRTACPEGERDCDLCEAEKCHACQGYGTIDLEMIGQAECPACRGTGWLSAQLLGIADPLAQESVRRSERGLEP